MVTGAGAFVLYPRFALPLLVALVFLAYAGSLDGEFVFDDRLVMENTRLINIESLGDVLATGSTWRGLTEMSYGLNLYLGQLDPFGYHLVNVVIHAINVILVYLILLELVGGYYPALTGAALFGVHPLLTEAVANVAGRASSLCGLFYFCSVFAFLKALNSERMSVRIVWWCTAGAAGLLAWQAKQEAITLPVALAGLLWIRSESRPWRAIVLLLLFPLGLVVLIRAQIASLFGTVMENRELVSAGFEQVLPLATYVRTYVSGITGYYLPRFLVPVDLSADPYFRPVEHWYSLEFLFALAVLGGMSWFLLKPGGLNIRVRAGLALLLLSPLTAYAAIPLADVLLEHRTYIPSLGVGVLSAIFFEWLRMRYGRIAHVGFLALIAVFTLMTVQRNAVWANSVALWEDTESKSPEKPRAHFNLAEAYQLAGQIPDAVKEYRHALDIKPDLHSASSNLALIYLDHGRLDEAEETLLRVTELAPDFGEGFVNLSNLYLRRGDLLQVIEVVDRALTIDKTFFAAHFNKGEAFRLMGEFAQAVASYQHAVDLRPDLPEARLKLGEAYYQAGDRRAAERQFQLLLEEPAVSAEAYQHLGALHAQSGDDERALEYLLEAIRLRPEWPKAQHDLGVVYLRNDMMDEAIGRFETAIRQQSDHGPAHLNLALAYYRLDDLTRATEILESYMKRYGSTGGPYVAQAAERLRDWRR